MIVAVVGSRQWPEPDRVRQYVIRLAERHPDAVLLSGGARGSNDGRSVDWIAETAARAWGLPVASYRPYETTDGVFSVRASWWGAAAGELVRARFDVRVPPRLPSYGRAAFARNVWIAEDADVVCAFDAGSRGTQHTIAQARRLGRPVFVYRPQRLAARHSS